MTRIATAVTFALLAGCSYSEEQFVEDSMEATCDTITGCEADLVAQFTAAGAPEAQAQEIYASMKTAACESTPSSDTDASESPLGADCVFNSAKAKECINGLKDLECSDLMTEGALPAACDEVCDGE